MNPSDLLLEGMHAYVAMAEEDIATRKRQCHVLHDEVIACRQMIQSLKSDLLEVQAQANVQRVSQFQLEKLKSGGTMQVTLKKETENVISGLNKNACQSIWCCQVDDLGVDTRDFFEHQIECQDCDVESVPKLHLHKTTRDHNTWSVTLPMLDPCPSPIEGKNERSAVVVDVAQTMCDVWSGWSYMEEKYFKQERRKAVRRRTYLKGVVHKAFGSSTIPVDSTLFRAVCGFMEGSQEQCHYDVDDSLFVVNYIKRLDQDVNPDKGTRATKTSRKELLAQMVTYMYAGEVASKLEQAFVRKRRFSTVKLARVSDMNSSFNPSALGAIASCEGGKEKGEMGLLCAESTLRRCMGQVYHLSQNLGFYSLPLEDAGTVWCWGDNKGLLTTAIHRYVKRLYYDPFCDTVTETSPWIVPLTGDLVRTSQRGTFVTVLGPKLADIRHALQEQTGKTMCQSTTMYTPAVAGYKTESELMPYFHLMVQEFRKIEQQQFCVVNGKKFKLHLKIIVVADLSFMHKYTERGGGSHAASCFCMLCGALRNFKHIGYPGGCRRCRALGIVYDEDGIQVCPHYDLCTDDFLNWQAGRYAELRKLVPDYPLTSLPAWDNVKQLRDECLKRCVGEWEGWHARISKKSGKGTMTARELSDWIMNVTRDDATLSTSAVTGVMYCPIGIVRGSLASRKVNIKARTTQRTLRLQLRDILQLEQEYTRMSLHMKDARFSAGVMKGLPIDRLIVCVLHLPMRTHEKVLTMLCQQACQNRLSSQSQLILDDMVIIIRRLAKLKATWTYKWNTKANCVEKIKMHWDQSKKIFKQENMESLGELVRLAVVPESQGHWLQFLAQYIKLIDLLTVTRDYCDNDLKHLERYCNETYRLLLEYCGGKEAVTNYFHYLGAGHVVSMCLQYGNIWRLRNEGVEAWNKTLSKRTNMFNSSGNKGNITGKGNVLPFEVLGKWMGRYAMWQLDFANDLFIPKGGALGVSKICYDPNEELWEYVSDEDSDSDDGYSSSDDTQVDADNSDSDLEPFTPDDELLCVFDLTNDALKPRLRQRTLSNF